MQIIKWQNTTHRVSIIVSSFFSIICFLFSIFSASLILSLIRSLFIFILTGSFIWFILNVLEKYNIRLKDFIPSLKDNKIITKKNVLNNRKKSKIIKKEERIEQSEEMEKDIVKEDTSLEQKAKRMINNLEGDMKSKMKKIANIISLKLKGEE